MHHRKSAQKGFTLVEIMIVVVIIGLLAAMAIPAFNKVRLQSRVKAVTNNLRQVASAAQQYMLDKGVTVVTASQLIGTATDDYLRTISPIGQENYATITVDQTTSQISATDAAFGTVTYNL
jgi:type IV pilus assembly protein PilA